MKAQNWMLVFSVLSMAAGVQLSAGAARAANVAPNLTGIARNADGSYRLMNQSAADSYCRNEMKMRLPTARELAEYAQSLGSQGISETAEDGYHLVKGSDSAGNPDNFYFSFKGYQTPAGDFGNAWFWSSSVAPGGHSNSGYGLYGNFGEIGLFSSRWTDGAVRCVAATVGCVACGRAW